MAYCDICGNFDDEYTDGEPSVKALKGYSPLLDFHYSRKICSSFVDGGFRNYDWSEHYPDIDCMCEICFNRNKIGGRIKCLKP